MAVLQKIGPEDEAEETGLAEDVFRWFKTSKSMEIRIKGPWMEDDGRQCQGEIADQDNPDGGEDIFCGSGVHEARQDDGRSSKELEPAFERHKPVIRPEDADQGPGEEKGQVFFGPDHVPSGLVFVQETENGRNIHGGVNHLVQNIGRIHILHILILFLEREFCPKKGEHKVKEEDSYGQKTKPLLSVLHKGVICPDHRISE